MKKGNAAALVVFMAIGVGAVKGANADEVIVLEPDNSGFLTRSDAPTPPPHTSVGRLVTGLEEGERIVAIDTRPGFPLLYGITEKRLYAINHLTGVATAVGPRFRNGPPASWRQPVSFDIHPVTDAGFAVQPTFLPGADGPFLETRTQSINLETGEAGAAYPVHFTDPPAFAYVEGDPAFGASPRIDIVAFAGDLGGPVGFTQFGIDTARNSLVRIGSSRGLLLPTDDGRAVTTVAELSGLPAAPRLMAMEIGKDGVGLLLVRVTEPQADSSVYRLDLATGAATLMWDAGEALATDLAVLPSYVPGPARVLNVTNAVAHFDFRASRRPGDSLAITGTLPTPAGGVRGRKVAVDVDGVIREFVLDTRGRGRSGPDLFRLVAKRGGTSRFTLVVRRAQFDGFAAVNRNTASGDTRMLVDLFVDGAPHRQSVDLFYAARLQRGLATLAKP